jgi:hypothetical protein
VAGSTAGSIDTVLILRRDAEADDSVLTLLYGAGGFLLVLAFVIWSARHVVRATGRLVIDLTALLTSLGRLHAAWRTRPWRNVAPERRSP